jgi:tetrahydromethanopterin S-methyltransferase subunit G
MVPPEIKGYSTVKEVSERIGVTPARVRQILQEIRKESGRDLGILAGTVRLLESDDVLIIEAVHSKKREYRK